MASANNNYFYTQSTSNYDLQLPAEAFINIDNVVFNEQIESNFLKASKKITKEPSKKIMRKKHNKARNPWTPQEDAKLVELMKKHGQSWAMISASMEGRTGKQIRDRYLNKLRPNIKCGDWTAEEDERMIKLLNEVGNRWSLIATHLPGRTEGQVKNHYYSAIKKRLEANGALSQTSATRSASETTSSFPTSPECEEMKLDFGYEFDASFLNSYATEPAVQNNQSSNYTISKGPYAFHEGTIADPTSVISYNISDSYFFEQPQTSDVFVLPTIEDDSQVDEVLDHATNYFLDNSSSSDVDSYFSDDLKSEKKYSNSEQEKLALLSKRKAYLELALAKTLKELKGF